MELRQYQIENTKKAIDMLDAYGIAYLAAEVRTGKTLTALNIANELKCENVLFVTKKNAISTIENEFNQCKYNYKLTVINYESVKKKINNFDFVICDEAHSLGTYAKPSKRWRDTREYCVGKRVLLLSGTPSPESYSQLYHQFGVSDYSPWRRYRNFYGWAKDYVIKRTKHVFNREIPDYSFAREKEIKNDIEKYMIRFSQSDAGFNKTVREDVRYVDMEQGVHHLISTLKRDKVYEITGDDSVMADTAVKMQSKFHQIYSGTVKTEGGKYLIIDYTKANYIKKEFAGKKIAIFYKFIAELQMINDVFENVTNDPFEFINTGTDTIFARQFVSGREGINLSVADYLIYLNIDFSALSYLQSKERINVKDREKEAIAVWIFGKGGIEEKIYKRVINKKDFTLGYFLRDFNINKDMFNGA